MEWYEDTLYPMSGLVVVDFTPALMQLESGSGPLSFLLTGVSA